MLKKSTYFLPLLLCLMVFSCGQEAAIETKEALLERIAKSESYLAQKDAFRTYLDIQRNNDLDLVAIHNHLDKHRDGDGNIESWDVLKDYPGAKEYFAASTKYFKARDAFLEAFPSYQNLNKEDKANVLLMSDNHTGYSPIEFINPAN